MKTVLQTIVLSLFCVTNIFANEVELDSVQLMINQIEASLDYKQGVIEFEEANAQINVPEGFSFLDKEQSQYVLSDLWGNPKDEDILGMLVPTGKGVLGDSSWAYTITFDEMGYVSDEDAQDIDYDELLAEQQAETREGNAYRVQEGYEEIELIGWASAPYYDADRKVLHWARELEFGGDPNHTLNYNLRVLGRKGVFMINAIASMPELGEVNKSIDGVLSSVTFDQGFQYADFSPEVDNVAAWTVGGLVAGKVLAKTGIFAVLAKFAKFIFIGIAAVGSFIVKLFKKSDD